MPDDGSPPAMVRRPLLTPELADAASEGALETVTRALDAGFDVNSATEHGVTLLMEAASSGRAQLVALLLERGADVNARTWRGTALNRAASNQDVASVRRLLDAGAVVDATDDYGNTPLMDSITSSHGASPARRRATVEALLQAGADPDHENAGKTTPRKQDALKGGIAFGREAFAREVRRGPPGQPAPTKRRLSRELGVKAPDAYVALQRLAFGASETSSQWQQYYLELLGFYFAGAMPEYRADPPEMLVFGATGVDGIQIGYVVHAPELDLDDYPVVKSYPIGYELSVLGRNTVEAVKYLALKGRDSSAELSATESEQLEALGKEFGVNFGRARPTTERWPLRPKARRGYTFLATTDGVGVFAPIDAFARRSEPAKNVWSRCEEALGVAEQALRSGTPGTALVISKNALYDDPDSPHADELRRLAARAYRQLGRRLHARRVLAECSSGPIERA